MVKLLNKYSCECGFNEIIICKCNNDNFLLEDIYQYNLYCINCKKEIKLYNKYNDIYHIPLKQNIIIKFTDKFIVCIILNRIDNDKYLIFNLENKCIENLNIPINKEYEIYILDDDIQLTIK